jgi:hypothetical protein
MFGVIDVVSVVVMFRVTPTLGGFGFAEVFLMTALAGCAFARATSRSATSSACASTCGAVSSTRCSCVR